MKKLFVGKSLSWLVFRRKFLLSQRRQHLFGAEASEHGIFEQWAHDVQPGIIRQHALPHVKPALGDLAFLFGNDSIKYPGFAKAGKFLVMKMLEAGNAIQKLERFLHTVVRQGQERKLAEGENISRMSLRDRLQPWLLPFSHCHVELPRETNYTECWRNLALRPGLAIKIVRCAKDLFQCIRYSLSRSGCISHSEGERRS